MLILYVVTILLKGLNAVYLDDYDHQPKARGAPSSDDLEFEPVMTESKEKEKEVSMKNINCDSFSDYARNCTNEAALMYNSVKKSPPLPANIYDWCKAIRHLTNCAIDWNSDCKDVTESHFNEESIRGHMHVVNNICNDEMFLTRYDDLPSCIEGSAEVWEKCYSTFKTAVDEQKNTTHEWTHFETHFFMCCARASFRRCTADALFDIPKVCPYEQAVTLQQFSAIVSEGDVYQNCDINMMYSNCPGGDPRPTGNSLYKLINKRTRSSSSTKSKLGVILLILYAFVCGFIK